MESTSVDLVLSTLGARPAELERFLDGLERQSHRNFRLVAVDQSKDGWVAEQLGSAPPGFPVVAIRSSGGVSRGRNDGLRHVGADVVAFPDDDCWYAPDVLERVVGLLETHAHWDGVSGRSLDSRFRPSNMRWHRHVGPITKLNCWNRAIAYTLFFRRVLVAAVGAFDETLGPPLPAGEETDFVLRALERGFSLRYEPSLAVHHPQKSSAWRESARLGHIYGVGTGLVLRRYRYPAWFALWRVAQPALGVASSLVRGRPAAARFYLAMARGRLRGWLRGSAA